MLIFITYPASKQLPAQNIETLEKGVKYKPAHEIN